MELSGGRPAGRAPIGSPIVTAPSDEVLHRRRRGTGLATVTADGVVLDVWYPAPRLPAEAGPQDAATGSGGPAGRGANGRHPGRAAASSEHEIASLADAPADTADAYLRLHLLSARLVRPRTINLDGIFALLPNNAWTSLGPVPADDLERVRLGAATPASGCRCSVSTSSRG